MCPDMVTVVEEPQQAAIRILLLEADLPVALDTEAILLASGIAVVDIVRTSKAALALLKTTDVDAAILDIPVADRDIVALVGRLSAADTPFVFATAWTPGELASLVGASPPIVAKPYGPAEIIAAIDRLLGR